MRNSRRWSKMRLQAGPTLRLIHAVGLKAFLVGLLITMLPLSGCRLGVATTIDRSPYNYDEQVAKILEIAPKETDRADVIRRLEEAGVQGTFGISQSIYYCDVWQNEDGTRWHMNVALLFDKDGKLYDTRRGEASVDISSAGKSSE